MGCVDGGAGQPVVPAGRASIKVSIATPVKLALWLQNGRLRVFVNGDKQIDANQVDLPPIDKVEIRVLVTQFTIDAARLTTAGLGATKPIDTNDTPQGRAQNRRMEFSKQ